MISLRHVDICGVPIHSARSMPSACGPSVPQPSNAAWLVWAPSDSPNTTTLGRLSGGIRRIRSRIFSHSVRFCSLAPFTLPSDSGDGRFEYCSVTEAMSPKVMYCTHETAT